MYETVYYAIGDIHGQADSLQILHGRIFRYHAKNFPNTAKTIVHLGDYIDRGPDSFKVIETIMALEKISEVKVINLKGNHEQLMLDAYFSGEKRAYSLWLDNGGKETLNSYRAHGFNEPSEKHLNWLMALPSLHWDKEAGLVFVHAGIDPYTFPHESDEIRLWTRSRVFFNPERWESPDLEGMRVIHGHTPTETDEPDIALGGRRINVDTGACYGGPLTAVVLAPKCDVQFLCAV